MGSSTEKPVVAELDELRAQIAALTERLAELAKAVGAPAGPPAPVQTATPAPSPAPATPPPSDVSDEILILLGAAVAAYLGKRAPIRHVRLLGSTAAWGQQGRVNIQASHGLNVQHTK